MPLWSCDVSECSKWAVRKGHCLLCSKRFCVLHVDPDFHTCPTSSGDYDAWRTAHSLAEDAEIRALASRVNLDALCGRASSLRSGVPCTIAPLSFAAAERARVTGGRHYHIRVPFADGVVWMARIPRENVASPPAAHRDQVLLSEVATLGFLGRTKIPVPAVHDYALEGPDNAIGVGYILMDHVRGSPLNFGAATPEQQRRVLDQLADIFIELEKHPFPAIGSLCAPGTDVLHGRTEEETADLDGHGNLAPFGPFSGNASYLRARIAFRLALVRRREAHAARAVDAYLVHRYLADTLVPAQPVAGAASLFYLKHMDDKGDHILVDDDCNITAVIDWEWAQTTSRAEAFCAPLFLLDVRAFYSGDNALSVHERSLAAVLEGKGRPDLAALVRDGRVQHRIMFVVGGDVEDGLFGRLFEGFLELQLGRGRQSVAWDDWRSEALAKYAGEEDMIRLVEEDRGRGGSTREPSK